MTTKKSKPRRTGWYSGSFHAGYLEAARPGKRHIDLTNMMKMGMAYASLEGACAMCLDNAVRDKDRLKKSAHGLRLWNTLPLVRGAEQRRQLDVVETFNWLSGANGTRCDWALPPLSEVILLKQLRNVIFHVPLKSGEMFDDGSVVHNQMALRAALEKRSPWKNFREKPAGHFDLATWLKDDACAQWAVDSVVAASNLASGWLPESAGLDFFAASFYIDDTD